MITIYDLSYICSDFLKEVIQFLKDKENTDFRCFCMTIQKKYGKSNIDSQCHIYKHLYNQIGYDLVAKNEYERYILRAKKFDYCNV